MRNVMIDRKKGASGRKPKNSLNEEKGRMTEKKRGRKKRKLASKEKNKLKSAVEYEKVG